MTTRTKNCRVNLKEKEDIPRKAAARRIKI